MGRDWGLNSQMVPDPTTVLAVLFPQNSGLLYINMVCDDGNDTAGAVRSVGLLMDWMVANFLLGERSQERHRR